MKTVKAKSQAETLGQRIKRIRLSRKLSQRDLAAKCVRVSYAYISRIEANTRNPSIRALIQLGDALDVTAHELLTGHAYGQCQVCKRF